jgi:hypothetical protein
MTNDKLLMTNQNRYNMKKLILRIFIIFALSFLVFPIPVLAKNYTQPVENGMIDWSNGFVEAVGIGAPPKNPINSAQGRAMAERTAATVARRHLRDIIYGIPIDSRTLIKDFVVQRDIIRSELHSLLKNPRVVDISYLSDGSVKTRVAIKLTGSIANLVLPNNIRTIKAVEQPQVPNKEGEGIFTGLVVDCRGFPVKPAMVPRIVDEEGREVYGSTFASRDCAVRQGMTGYAKSLKASQPNLRISDRPLAVKGIRTTKGGLSNIVISNADAAKIRGTASNLSFLQKCRVMIVLD